MKPTDEHVRVALAKWFDVPTLKTSSDMSGIGLLEERMKAALETVFAMLPDPAQEGGALYKVIEKILDEHSAWIARPNKEVTTRIALAAAIAAQKIEQELAEFDRAGQPQPACGCREALEQAEKMLEYYADEHTTFSGTGTPISVLAAVRAALASCKPGVPTINLKSFPWQRHRHPPGCQDVDYCRGNKICHWDCQGES